MSTPKTPGDARRHAIYWAAAGVALWALQVAVFYSWRPGFFLVNGGYWLAFLMVAHYVGWRRGYRLAKGTSASPDPACRHGSSERPTDD